jgi:twitching motility protein PilU
MSALSEEQARAYMHKLLAAMSQQGGSDLFISNDFPPSMKAHGTMQPLAAQKLTGDVTKVLAHALMNEEQRADFAKDMECNFAISIPGLSRFRVNVFVQQRCVGMVIRTIAAEIPNFEKLGLPEILKEVIMNKRGLDDRSPQSHLGRSHHHGRGSRGICASIEDVTYYTSRGRCGYPHVAPRIEEHIAAGTRRDFDR